VASIAKVYWLLRKGSVNRRVAAGQRTCPARLVAGFQCFGSDPSNIPSQETADFPPAMYRAVNTVWLLYGLTETTAPTVPMQSLTELYDTNTQ
jgi:hypothetical protein